jgi:putative tryptophan/tyrosine transport system substrate-binding protein
LRDKADVSVWCAVGFQAFRDELRALGLSEGVNFVIEEKALDDPRGPSISATELIQWRPDVVVIAGPEIALQSVLAAKHSGPIVLIAINFDPIVHGYVKSLSHPGGNITGVVFQQLALAQKQVDWSRRFPIGPRLVALFDAQSADQFAAAEQTAKSLGMQVQRWSSKTHPMISIQHLEVHRRVRHKLQSPYRVAFLHPRVPRLSSWRSRGVSTKFIFGNYVVRFEMVQNPNLPIEQADKFEFIVNLKTASSLLKNLW